MPAGDAIRERRVGSGLTQGELAARAGVSRQLIAAVEAGRNTPGVDSALRIAGALGTTVEDLFAKPPQPATAAVGDALRERVPLRVGRVGDRLVAAELPDRGAAGAGWAKADGRLEQGKLRLFEGALANGLVLAGCDPAFGVAEQMLEGLGERSLLAISTSSGRALEALQRGTIHAAVLHGPAGALPAVRAPVIRLHVAKWQVGLGVSGSPRASMRDVLAGGIPVVVRDPGAASQQAFERTLTAEGLAPPASARVATGHLDAARSAAVLDGAAVTTEAAAAAFGLSFLPFEEHVVELWIAERWREHPGVPALGELLSTRAFTERVAQYGGYDLSGCGRMLAARTSSERTSKFARFAQPGDG